ncbi:hypothetical protein GCM10022227_14890 [Streptomyces sedi]
MLEVGSVAMVVRLQGSGTRSGCAVESVSPGASRGNVPRWTAPSNGVRRCRTEALFGKRRSGRQVYGGSWQAYAHRARPRAVTEAAGR